MGGLGRAVISSMAGDLFSATAFLPDEALMPKPADASVYAV